MENLDRSKRPLNRHLDISLFPNVTENIHRDSASVSYEREDMHAGEQLRVTKGPGGTDIIRLLSDKGIGVFAKEAPTGVMTADIMRWNPKDKSQGNEFDSIDEARRVTAVRRDASGHRKPIGISLDREASDLEFLDESVSRALGAFNRYLGQLEKNPRPLPKATAAKPLQ
jgi:hypothetical protein